MTDSPALTIIIPAYNEERRLEASLRSIRADAVRRNAHWQVVVINDGSEDATADVARAFDAAPLDLSVLQNPRNRGKGHCARRGVLEARGTLILLTDADLSTPISELDRLLRWFDEGYDIVIGSRDLPDSVLDPPQPIYRQVMGAAFRTVRRMLIVPALRDTQCGFKVYRRQVAERIFALQECDGYGYDSEVLSLADMMGYRIKEQAVRWCDDRDSRVRPVRDSLHMLWELQRTYRRIRRARRGMGYA